MIYDEYGQIRFNTAGDAEDSPMASALAICFTDMKVNVNQFFNNYMYQRCANSRYSVSRDQAIAIFTIISITEKDNNNLAALVDASRVNGNDLIFSIGSHISICKGEQPSWLQTKVFKRAIYDTLRNNKEGEQNQILLQLWKHPDNSLLKYYCSKNPYWHIAVGKWLRDRNEWELSLLMITKINQRINMQDRA